MMFGAPMTKANSNTGNPSPSSLRQRVSATFAESCATVMVFALATGVASAQIASSPTQPLGQDNAAPTALPLAGPRILSVSAYASYYSSALPETGSLLQTNSANLPADGGAGGSIAFGWSKFTERTTFSLSYSPSYTAQVRNSSLNALNHVFGLNVARKLDPRWTLGFSAAANYSTLEESLFAPTTLGNLASVPSNASDLAAGLLAGKFTNNPQLGVILNGSPLVESPIASLLYGQRILMTSARGTLSYSLSPRLSLSFGGGAGRTQYLSPNQSSTSGTPQVVSNTTSGTASVTLSYSYSPVTQLGGTVTTNRLSSSLEDVYTTTSVATFGRTVGQHWIVQLHGGVGITNPVSQTSILASSTPRPAIGGTLGFKSTTQTLLGSFDRTVSDSYGLGASSSSTASFTWGWHRLGSLWALENSLSWQQLTGNAVANTYGWRATAGVNRAVGPHLTMLLQYTYLKYSGGLQTAVYTFSESAVRISTIWTPAPNVHR